MQIQDDLNYSNSGSLLSKVWHIGFTDIDGSGEFKGALQEAGPELRQGLVQVESRSPVVLPQVGVQTSIETSVLGVESAKWRQHLLEGALRATVQLSKVR